MPIFCREIGLGRLALEVCEWHCDEHRAEQMDDVHILLPGHESVKMSLSNTRLLVGVILGYLVGDLLLNLNKIPEWRGYVFDVFTAILVIGFLVALLFPRYHLIMKYNIGQVGAWLTSLIIGGWLPLVKDVIYSFDFWSYVILLPIHTGILLALLGIHKWFDIPHPEPETLLWDSFRRGGNLLPDLE